MRNQKLSRMAEPLFLINVYIKNYSEKTVHKSIPVENTTKKSRKFKSRINTHIIVLTYREFYADHFGANYRSPWLMSHELFMMEIWFFFGQIGRWLAKMPVLWRKRSGKKFWVEWPSHFFEITSWSKIMIKKPVKISISVENATKTKSIKGKNFSYLFYCSIR